MQHSGIQRAQNSLQKVGNERCVLNNAHCVNIFFFFFFFFIGARSLPSLLCGTGSCLVVILCSVFIYA